MTSTSQPQMLSLGILHKASVELQSIGKITASINVNLEHPVRDLVGFRPVPEYPVGLMNYELLPNEIGRCGRIIFVLSDAPENENKIIFTSGDKTISYDVKVDQWYSHCHKVQALSIYNLRASARELGDTSHKMKVVIPMTLEPDARDLTGFFPVIRYQTVEALVQKLLLDPNYANFTVLDKDEIGRLERFYIVVSNEAKPNTVTVSTQEGKEVSFTAYPRYLG